LEPVMILRGFTCRGRVGAVGSARGVAGSGGWR
jgi:hypothetical protein